MTRYVRMSTPSRSASCLASALGRTLKPDDERVRGRREVDVVLGDPADAGVDHVDAHLRVLDLAELADAAPRPSPARRP